MTSGQVGKHSAPRRGGGIHSKWVLVAGAAVVIAGVAGGAVAIAANRGPSAAAKRAQAAQAAHARQVAEEEVVHTAQAQLLGSIRILPASGATNVPLDHPGPVSTTSGKLAAVQLVGAAGGAVVGHLSPTGEWVSTASLLPGTTYTVSVEAAANGVTVDHSSTFSTLTPAVTVTASVYPTTGMTVGVGQPLIVELSHDITSPAVQKAIDARLTVAMSTPVSGAWYWFNDHELHFRPQQFWPAHETVQVSADLDGIDVGAGVWTGGSVLDTFGIGDARISYANLAAEVMTVTLNGKTLYSFPISGGRPQYPTMDGVHIVMDRESVVHMVSSTVGIPVSSPNGYDEYVYDDVHISDSGEYVHAAPWSVADQGFTNVSHGCINLSTANAQTFFNYSRVGDVVEVTGSPRPPAWGDHGVMDWSGPAWSEWTPATVVALSTGAPTPPSTTTTSAAPTTASAVAPAVAVRPAVATTVPVPSHPTATEPTTTVH